MKFKVLKYNTACPAIAGKMTTIHREFHLTIDN